MKIQEIDKAIEKCQCPEPTLCIVGSTTYEFRENICLKCWLKFCKEQGIEVEYE